VAGSAWTSKVIVSLVSIVSIRELLSYLGEERYAVYLIAYSLTVWFLLTQFNIGTSLQNFISQSRAKNENYDKYMLSALQCISLLFILFFILILFLSTPAQNMIFRKFPMLDEPVVFIIGIISLITALAGIVYNVYFAEHKGYIPNIFPAIAAVISLLLILIVKHYNVSASIVTALLIFTGPQLLFILFLFFKTFKKFFSRIFEFDFANIKNLCLRASKFYLLGILGIIYTQTDYIIASQVLSAEEIIRYGIFMRFFLFPIFIYESLLTAAWPVRGEMFIKKNYAVLKGMISRYSYYGIIIVVLCAVPIFIFSDFLIKILAPDSNIKAGAGFIILFTVYAVVRTLYTNYSYFLQSANVLRIFMYFMPFQIITNIVSQYYFAKIYGAEGIVIGLILSLVLTSLWVLPIKTYKVLK